MGFEMMLRLAIELSYEYEMAIVDRLYLRRD